MEKLSVLLADQLLRDTWRSQREKTGDCFCLLPILRHYTWIPPSNSGNRPPTAGIHLQKAFQFSTITSLKEVVAIAALRHGTSR